MFGVLWNLCYVCPWAIEWVKRVNSLGVESQGQWVARGCVGAKDVIKMNMMHCTYIPLVAGCRRSDTGQQAMRPF